MARRAVGEIAAAPEMAAEIRELLAQGLSKRAIAARLGVSETTVYRCLRREETKSKKLPRPRDPHPGLVAELAGGAGRPVRRPGETDSAPRAAAGDSSPGKTLRAREAQIPEMASWIRIRQSEEQESRGAEGFGDEEDDGYPEALLLRVPRDFVAILPRGHYLALVHAAERDGSASAVESLRQALLLHAEPMIPPPTSIELVLSEEEELEVGKAGAGSFSQLDRDFTIG